MAVDAPVVPVTVTLAPSLFEAVERDAEAVRRDVELQVSELAADLGIDARPAAELEVGGSASMDALVRVSVHGVPCPFPRPTIAEATAYVEGTPRIAPDIEAVRDRLRQLADSGHELVSEALALVARAAVSAQPGVLLGATAGGAQRTLLDHGISLRAGDEHTPDLASGDAGATEALIVALSAGKVDVEVHPDYLRILAAADPRGESFPLLRDGLFVELGLTLPPFHFRRPDFSLRARGFAFWINAVRTLPRIALEPGTILVNETADRLAELYDVEAEETLNPATRQPGALAPAEKKTALEEQGLTTWEPPGFLILSFADALRRRAHAFMTRDVAEGMVGQLDDFFPVLAAAAREYVPAEVLAPVLRELLLDGVPVRNLRRILELVLRYETTDGTTRPRDRAAFVRVGLSDLIADKAARGTATVVAYLLDPAIEAALSDGVRAAAPADVDAVVERVRSAVRAEFYELPPTAAVPALLTQDDVRVRLRDILRHEFPQMAILGYSDLPLERNVQPVARISWA